MPTTTAPRNAHWVGRIIRLGFGAGALGLVYVSVRGAGTTWLPSAAAWLAGIFAFYFVSHWMIQRFWPNLNRWAGAVVANAPAVTLIFSGIGVAQIAALVYVGASLVVDSVSGDAGCEVMAFPGLLTGKRTHLACIAFSPIDWLEAQMIERFARVAKEGAGES